MNSSFVVNMEYLNLFDPSMLDGEEVHQVLPIEEDLLPQVFEELDEDTQSKWI